MVLFTALPLCVALDAGLPTLLAGRVLGGGALAFWSVMWATGVQTRSPLAVLNRVTAYEMAGSVSGIALGQILAGPALALAAPERLLLVSAGTCLAGCVALLVIPAIRTLHHAASTDSGSCQGPDGPPAPHVPTSGGALRPAGPGSRRPPAGGGRTRPGCRT